MESAEYYRQKAAELRARSARTRRRDVKEQLLEVALHYEGLAEQVEEIQRWVLRNR